MLSEENEWCDLLLVAAAAAAAVDINSI